jgi:hypothetical protein
MNASLQAGAWLTPLGSMCSDLLRLDPGMLSNKNVETFRCGNFGVIVMDKERRKNAIEILKTMVRVTMMRGAQSGGVVTYVPSGWGSTGSTGIRSRVVNGKRTNLSHLVTSKVTPLPLSSYSCKFHLVHLPLRFLFHSKSHQHTCLNIMFRLEEQPDNSGYTILLILHWFVHVSHDAVYKHEPCQSESLEICVSMVATCCVLFQVKKDEFWASLTHGLRDGVRFYAGHTRFATSSIVSPQTPIVFPYYATRVICTLCHFRHHGNHHECHGECVKFTEGVCKVVFFVKYVCKGSVIVPSNLKEKDSDHVFFQVWKDVCA